MTAGRLLFNSQHPLAAVVRSAARLNDRAGHDRAPRRPPASSFYGDYTH